MESVQQDAGGATQSRRRQSESLQSARSALGLRDNLINALELLANQQEDGDSPIFKAL